MKSYKTPKYDRGTIVRKSEIEGETRETKEITWNRIVQVIQLIIENQK